MVRDRSRGGRMCSRGYIRIRNAVYVREVWHSRARSREKCMEKAVLFGAQLLEAPQAEFGESWTLDKTYLAC